MPGAELVRDLLRGEGIGAGGDSHQQAFLDTDLLRSNDRMLRGYSYDLIDFL
jgi:hypothetical protein